MKAQPTLSATACLVMLLFGLTACNPIDVRVAMDAKTSQAIQEARESINEARTSIETLKHSLEEKAALLKPFVQDAESFAVDSANQLRDEFAHLGTHERDAIARSVIESHEIKKLITNLETARRFECYSDQRRFIRIKKLSETSAEFKLIAFCFSLDSLAENTSTEVAVSSAYARGLVIFDPKDGLLVNADDVPVLQNDNYPSESIRAALAGLVRIAP